MTSVRVGICIRRPAVKLNLNCPARVIPSGTGSPFTLKPGQYEAQVVEEGTRPLWGARVATFADREQAVRTRDALARHGIECALVEQGEELDWGDGPRLDTRVTSLVFGEDEDSRRVLERARRELAGVPADHTHHVPGLRRYEDELPRVEPVRLASPEGGRLRINDVEGHISRTLPSPVRLEMEDPDRGFELAEVTIGIDFHWEHHESLRFRGDLDLVVDGDAVTAVNEVELDDYLASLLGSEMRPDWPAEALKAQAVAARSTVLATRRRHHYGEAFQLCHDDHCQCYQGMGREGETAREVLDAVSGQLLVHGERVADARYAKISGVLTEDYDAAWDDETIPYLVPVPCGPSDPMKAEEADEALRGNGYENLRRWLRDPPEWTACNPHSHPYPPSARDMERLFRWRVHFTWDELSALVQLRTGRDIGNVRRLEPLQRGISGRIIYLRVHGENETVTVGKELAIRRLLSESHLPSSAFMVSEDKRGVTLNGLGWGHGVGLCQLGAAGLATDGWPMQRLLALFYPNSTIRHA